MNKFFIINELATIPVHKTKQSAGADLQTLKQEFIRKGEITSIKTGLGIALDKGQVGLITIRSSLAKQGIIIINSPGIVDADYRGEIEIMVTSLVKDVIGLPKGKAFAQLIATDYHDTTLRRDVERTGGFGSTDSRGPAVYDENIITDGFGG